MENSKSIRVRTAPGKNTKDGVELISVTRIECAEVLTVMASVCSLGASIIPLLNRAGDINVPLHRQHKHFAYDYE